MRASIVAVLIGLSSSSALAQTEKVVEIESRGQKVRAILIQPANAVGSVILLAGGHGKLSITPDGTISWGKLNQLVRTRADYAKAGFNVLVPDIAPDLKTSSGVVNGYRAGVSNATDIGAEVKYMRGLKGPVVLIGTSRGTISAANAVGRLNSNRPDGLVLTSAFFGSKPNDFTVQKMAGNDPQRFNLPLLVVHHRRDECAGTAAGSVQPFKTWYEKSGRKLDVAWMEGGSPPKSDDCEAQSPHGFYGIDDKVVASISTWIKAQNLPSH